MNEKGKLIVISGASGVGKGTILKKFIENNQKVILSISQTTRYRRNGEIDGVHYFFVTQEEFQKNIKNDEFLEWAKYSDNFYGTNKKFVEKKLNEGIDIILEIDTQGAFQVKNKMPEAILIFILPPTFEELEKRLRNRNTESEEIIEKRLKFAKNEIDKSDEFDYRLVNDTIEEAVNDLQKIYGKIKNA